jgi:hypothetical protein
MFGTSMEIVYRAIFLQAITKQHGKKMSGFCLVSLINLLESLEHE